MTRNCRSNTPNPIVKSSKPKFTKKDFDLQRISELNKEHPAKIYLSKRQLPEKYLRDLYYCEHFKRWTNEQSIRLMTLIMMNQGLLYH